MRVLPGQYFDTETGNHYNYFRDYDPRLGRYIESDPIGLDGGENSYSYVVSSPVLLVDSLGLEIDWGGYILSNADVVQNLQKLNDELVNAGFLDGCFVLRVTGGDRYLDSRRRVRSLTDNSIVANSTANSPHLIGRGARAVDLQLEKGRAPMCCANEPKDSDVDNAVRKTSFDFRLSTRAYPDRHLHLGLPNQLRFRRNQTPLP
jgi:RHS repeat-associated protein